MKTRMITQICLTYVMICCLSFASPPSLPERNFDFSFQALEEPSQLGDILTVNWSFVLHHEADSLLEAIYSIDDSAIIAKAYIFTSPGLEYVSGDTLWWGHIKHDETHAFTASYRVVEPLIVGLRPIVETHAQPRVETLRTRTAGEGCRFDFRKKRKRDSTILLTANGDTVIFSNDVILPTDFARIDTNLFRKPWLEDTETARPKGFSDEIVLNLDGLRNNDTVEIPIMRDSILRITFMQENPSSWKIRDTDSIMQLMDLSEGIQLLLKTPIKERILHIDFENRQGRLIGLLAHLRESRRPV